MAAEGELIEGRDWTARDLEARARAAVDFDPIREEMTPPLPAIWPEATDRVVYYVYRSRSLATGVDRTSYRGPTRRVELRRGSDEPRVTTYETAADLGSQVAAGDWPEDFEGRMETAAQALLDYLAAAAEDTTGSAPPAPSAADEVWEPYRTWLRNRSLIAEDLRSRHPDFLGWVLGPAE
jgi:hypothetical protein